VEKIVNKFNTIEFSGGTGDLSALQAAVAALQAQLQDSGPEDNG